MSSRLSIQQYESFVRQLEDVPCYDISVPGGGGFLCRDCDAKVLALVASVLETIEAGSGDDREVVEATEDEVPF